MSDTYFTEGAAPVRRASVYDDGILDTICERLVAGEGLKTICRAADMPSEGAVYRAMAKDESVRSHIARAREAQQDAQADMIVEMADNATVEDWQVVKLRIWTRQWVMARLAPKKYGDRIIQEHSIGVSHEDRLAELDDEPLS